MPDCPYCRATAPSLNEFHDEFGGTRAGRRSGCTRPSPVPAPSRPTRCAGTSSRTGSRSPSRSTPTGAALHRLWLDRVPDAEFTSASLLIDRHGNLRHVQEGGVYAKDAADPRARKDYEAMRKAIVTLLAEPSS